MTSRKTAARAIVARANPKRRSPASAPAYASDYVETPRGKRRVLLDLAPDTARSVLEALRNDRARLAAAGIKPSISAVIAETALTRALEALR